jgi:uncharacterized membrane protein YgdD (TMEM256/DUF423 family)
VSVTGKIRQAHLLWVTVGGLLGALGIAAGAFGAHGLRGSVSPRDLEIWTTAAHYHQLHAVVLVVLGFTAGPRTALLRTAALLFVTGVAVFSGTLYAMVLGGPRMLGAITPLGGAALIAGWLCLSAYGLSRARTEQK